ncbi:hypothetical protein EI94DRAFT_1814685 [Lactarius quietus]|nr:hypothetical protein EI94DRAFT_1814685 [Lactarius quietus]
MLLGPPQLVQCQQHAQTPLCAEGTGLQTDLRVIALRVYYSVLSGVRALDGRALIAARAAPEQEGILSESVKLQLELARPGSHVMILGSAPPAVSSRTRFIVFLFSSSRAMPARNNLLQLSSVTRWAMASHASIVGSALRVVSDNGMAAGIALEFTEEDFFTPVLSGVL